MTKSFYIRSYVLEGWLRSLIETLSQTKHGESRTPVYRLDYQLACHTDNYSSPGIGDLREHRTPCGRQGLPTILKAEASVMFSSPPVTKETYDLNALDAFLFRIAYIQGLNTSKRHESEYPRFLSTWLPESGQLGDTRYPTLHTGGIGLNTSSYFDYIGRPREGFNVLANYTFNKLHGTVFGTHVNVKCTEAPHSLKTEGVSTNDNSFSTWYYRISTLKGAKLEFLAGLNVLKIGSALVNRDGLPVLTIAIPYDARRAFVTECTYSGNDFAASVSLGS